MKKFLKDIKDENIRVIAEDIFDKVFNERKKISGDKAYYSARAAALAKIAYLLAIEKEVK